jgi:hypothetical protein
MEYVGYVLIVLVVGLGVWMKFRPAQRRRRHERLQLRVLGRLMLDRAGAEELDFLFEFWDGTSFLYEMVEEKLIVRKEMVFRERSRRFHHRYFYEITPLGQKKYREHLRRYALSRTMISESDLRGVN